MGLSRLKRIIKTLEVFTAVGLIITIILIIIYYLTTLSI